jgi:hypothetical protein
LGKELVVLFAVYYDRQRFVDTSRTFVADPWSSMA